MTVKSIHTLGASPLSLLSKMGAAGGITILKNETAAESGGTIFPYRIIAKIMDGLYIEAKDAIYSLLPTYPNAAPYFNGNTTELMKTEAVQSDTARTFTSPSSKICNVRLGTNATDLESSASGKTTLSAFGKHSLSMLFTMPVTSTASQSSGSDEFTLAYSGECPMNPEKIVVAGELNTGESVNYLRSSIPGYGIGLFGPARSNGAVVPFGILNVPYNGLTGEYALGNNTSMALFAINLYNFSVLPMPIVISATDFRIAKSVDTSNELVTPTAWQDLPIFTDIASDGAGLYFHVGATRGHFLLITSVDTSKGNKMEGTFPAIYRNTPYAYNPNAVLETNCTVLGDATAETAEYIMSAYAPDIPIANDNVSGGPVVSNIFAVGSNEIRGAVKGVLKCSDNLGIGTIGWLDGIKYEVKRPGRMIKIG